MLNFLLRKLILLIVIFFFMNLWADAAQPINQVDFSSNNLYQGIRVLTSSQTHTPSFHSF